MKKWLYLLRLMPRISDAAEQLQVKAWWQSKTIVTNLIAVASSVAVVFGGAQFDVPPDIAAALAGGIVAAANIVLRILTNKPVGLRSVRSPAGSGHDPVEQHRDDNGI